MPARAVDHAADAGDACIDLDAGAGLGLRPAGMEGKAADAARRKIDRKALDDGVEAR